METRSERVRVLIPLGLTLVGGVLLLTPRVLVILPVADQFDGSELLIAYHAIAPLVALTAAVGHVAGWIGRPMAAGALLGLGLYLALTAAVEPIIFPSAAFDHWAQLVGALLVLLAGITVWRAGSSTPEASA